MKSRALFLLLALAGAVGCDDDAAEPESDASPGAIPDAGTKTPDARVTINIDAGADASIDATVAPDAAPEAGVCPPAIELRAPFILDEQVERTLPPALGGAITAGTYFLTKSELVINPQASASAKEYCRAQEPYSARQSLQFTPESSLKGTLLARTLDEDRSNGAYELDDYTSINSYAIDGTNLIIRPAGLACEDYTTTEADGGVTKEHEVVTPDNEDDPTTFTATADTLTLFEVWDADGPTTNCTYVSTLSK